MIYPTFNYGEKGPLYFVEFYGKNEFTVYKRNNIDPNPKFDENTTAFEKVANEGHPYNLFSAYHGPDGTIPDKNWVKFMIDQLNKE